MDGWDVALLVVAGYVAVTALARLMLRRRDRLIDALRRQAEYEQAAGNAPSQDSLRKSA